jgi:MoaA/NifB/PqqE/SkfB family radical SAM enzyme
VVNAKQEAKKSAPFVELQFIAMKHNEHEVGRLSEFAHEVGANSYRIVPMLFNDLVSDESLDILADRWLPHRKKHVHPHYWRFLGGEEKAESSATHSRLPPGGGDCFWLWRSLVINWDGGLAPCCLPFYEKDDFGNLLQHSIHDIWNNEAFRTSRTHIAGGKDPSPGTYCTRHCRGWPF